MGATSAPPDADTPESRQALVTKIKAAAVESARGFDVLNDNFGGQGAGLTGTLVFQADQGVTDLNFDGDSDYGDCVMHVLTLSTGVVENTPSLLSGSGVALKYSAISRRLVKVEPLVDMLSRSFAKVRVSRRSRSSPRRSARSRTRIPPTRRRGSRSRRCGTAILPTAGSWSRPRSIAW